MYISPIDLHTHKRLFSIREQPLSSVLQYIQFATAKMDGSAIGGGFHRLPFPWKESPITLEQDRFSAEGRRPRTKNELEEMLQSPQFRSEMLYGFAQIVRGEYVSYPIHEIKRRLRFDK